MNRLLLARLIFFLVALVIAPVSDATLSKLNALPMDIHNKESLQRGARLYMNYCSGCHSLRYLRYNRMAFDLGLTSFNGEVDKELLHNNLIFTQATPHDPIMISMPEEDARQWFGKLPPDLSLVARSRGADWLYRYLMSFYVDNARPFGANNLVMPDVAMPNVLAPLQGRVIAIKKERGGEEGLPLLNVQPGELSPQQFESSLNDLVTFLVYVAEPAQLIRYRIGYGVLMFLAVMALLTYRLKKIYWASLKGKYKKK